MAKLGRRASYEKRLRARQLIESGAPLDLVTEILGSGRATMFSWLQDFRTLGAEGLRTKKTRGPAAKLTDAQLARLYELIAGTDPCQLSFGFAPWTRAMVAELIRREFKVKLPLVSVGRVLFDHGLDTDAFIGFCKSQLTKGFGVEVRVRRPPGCGHFRVVDP